LDFPRSPYGKVFAEFLDRTIQEHGAWPNLIKDSRLTAATVANTYPEYEMFRSRLSAFDPERLYKSEMSERLSL
jgi:hypothetical protein